MLRSRSPLPGLPVLAIPLLPVSFLVAVLLGQGMGFSPLSPCLATPAGAIFSSSLPWLSDFRVAFSDDVQAATVRIRLVEDAAAADFVVADDTAATEAQGCEPGAGARFVRIVDNPEPGDPVVHLVSESSSRADTGGDRTDFQIYVRSSRTTAREAAAMLAASLRDRLRLAATAH
jgi:hypothetical protein